MNIRHLITRSIFLYKSFYRLIAIAVVVAVAVITGSLVVGDSVRSTLIKRVDERLGKTETVIFSQYSYLNDSILGTPGIKGHSRGMLLLNGFVSISGRFIPVMVWGTDDMEIPRGQAKVNNALFNEIRAFQPGAIVLRLPAAGMVPLGSMFVTDTYTTSLRLEVASVVPAEQGGNISLKNEQTIPFNIFVNREELAETTDTPGKINLILSDRIISADDFASAWNYAYSGLNAETENQVITITSNRIFIQDKAVETLSEHDPASNRMFAYLANSIRYNDTSIPYSFITAVDYFEGEALNPDEIILSDYTARRLNMRLNDTVSVSYFVSRQLKTLIEDSVFLRVGRIVPIGDLQADKALAANFPGLSNAARCTDWDSDLPINMDLITDEDEDYWSKYRNTPKAIVPYSALAPRWENAYGSATAVRISKEANRLNDLTHEMFDIQVINPREAGITAARLGIDFAGLFLSLGFFIIISAGMLMLVPLSEMLFRRRNELNLLKATGFSNKRISQLLWRESAPVVFASAIGGVIAGLVYTYLVLFLLGTVWKGATHTEGFKVYPNLITIVTGMSIGIIFSLSLLYIRIVRTVKKYFSTQVKTNADFYSRDNQKNIFKRICGNLFNLRHPRVLSAFSTCVFAGLLITNVFFIQSTVLFICSGIVFLFTAWTWIDYFIRKKGAIVTMPFDFSKLIWSALFHTKKQVMLSFITLASGVFIVFSVGLNRQGFADSSQIRTATGGFALWGESSVPVFHNISTEEGRARLALTDLHKDVQVVQLLKYSADDASCLNLNKVMTPNVLGIDMEEFGASEFKITKSIFNTSGENIYEHFKRADNAVYPALVDETVLMWSLGKKLGDTIVYTGEKGQQVFIQLAGTLQNSIFQGYILIDKTLFSEIWSEISGSEVMLVHVPDEAVNDTKMLISQALNMYGIRVMTTGERLRMFYSVTDTYLTIFMTLGGLGLLLGIFSFVIVVRKNIVARMKEINLYRSLGFDEKRIAGLLYKENIIIPLCAISAGASGSLLGVIAGMGNVSVWIWLLALVFLAIFIFSVMLFVKTSVRNYLQR